MYGGSGTRLSESHPSSARLVIRLLGTPQVLLDGQMVLSTQTPKALALLAYLAVEGDRAHPRSTLAALFWPDAPEAKAHQDLRQVLARLRQAIGEASAGPAHLLADARTIHFLSQSSAWLDVATFSGLVDSTERHPHRRLAACRTCLALRPAT